MAYEDRDVINNPSIYAEMVQKSGQSLSPCVEVDGHMLADVSGDEVEAYLLKAGVVQPTRLRRPTGLATRITMRILATSWTKQRKSRSKTPVAKVRETLKGNDNDAVKSAFDDLQAKFQEVSSELYKKASAQAGPQRSPSEGRTAGAEGEKKDSDVETRSSRWSTKIRRRIDRNPLETVPAPPMRRPGLTFKTNQHKDTHSPMAIVNIKPLGDRVLVHPLEEKEVKKGGIIIPDTAKEKPQEGEVVALGTGKRNEDGKIIEFTVKKGDRVLISKYGGTEVKIDGESYLIMREDDILGIIG